MVFDSAFGQFMANVFGSFDQAGFAFFGHMQCDWLTWINITLAGYGTEIFVVLVGVLGLILCFFRRTRKLGLIFGLSAFLIYVVCGLFINPLAGRLRPYNACQGDSEFFQWYLNAGTVAEGPYSFPSKHTAFDMCFGAAMLLFFYRDIQTRKAKIWGWVLVVLGLIVGVSRIYIMVHYPTDVMAGVLVGVGLGVFTYFCSGWILKFVAFMQNKFNWMNCFNLDDVYEKKTNRIFNIKSMYRWIIVAVIVFYIIGAVKIISGVNGFMDKCEYRSNDYACMNKADTKVYNEQTGEFENRCKLHK